MSESATNNSSTTLDAATPMWQSVPTPFGNALTGNLTGTVRLTTPQPDGYVVLSIAEYNKLKEDSIAASLTFSLDWNDAIAVQLNEKKVYDAAVIALASTKWASTHTTVELPAFRMSTVVLAKKIPESKEESTNG